MGVERTRQRELKKKRKGIGIGGRIDQYIGMRSGPCTHIENFRSERTDSNMARASKSEDPPLIHRRLVEQVEWSSEPVGSCACAIALASGSCGWLWLMTCRLVVLFGHVLLNPATVHVNSPMFSNPMSLTRQNKRQHMEEMQSVGKTSNTSRSVGPVVKG